MLIYNTYDDDYYCYYFYYYYYILYYLFFLMGKDTFNVKQQQQPHASVVNETNLQCFPEELLQGVDQ